MYVFVSKVVFSPPARESHTLLYSVKEKSDDDRHKACERIEDMTHLSASAKTTMGTEKRI